jgi:hypothetical protein
MTIKSVEKMMRNTIVSIRRSEPGASVSPFSAWRLLAGELDDVSRPDIGIGIAVF